VPTTLKAALDFNPDDAQQYLEGVDYPASKEEVVSVAQQNGAPDAMIRMLEGLSRHEFSGQEQILEDLRAFPRSN
jgi:hypothetical protein